MNAALLLEHYQHIAEAPDAIARLRRFILDLAVRGKLVEQDPNDEPASELLKRSQKRALTGRKAAMQDVMAEAPYDLPSSWSWVPVSAAFQYDAGRKVEPKALRSDAWLLELEDIEKDTGRLLNRSLVSERSPQSTKSEFTAGDILYGKLRPYLNKVIVAGEGGYSTTEIVALRPLVDAYAPYCALAFRRPDYVDYVSRLGQGTKMPRLRTEDALISPFPLPPLAEQHRIVAKVDELMSLCDQLEAARAERETGRDKLTLSTLAKLNQPDPETFAADASFALEHLEPLTKRTDQIKQLRQTILNLAVRGKLVARVAGEGSVSELLDSLRDIGPLQGRGRRAPSGGRLETSEFYLDIPPHWSWARIHELGITQTGTSPSSSNADLFGNFIPFVKPGDLDGASISYDGPGLSEEGVGHSRLAPAGTVMMVCIGATLGKVNVTDRDVCFNQQINSVTPHVRDIARFLAIAFKASGFQSLAWSKAGTGTLPIISKGKWEVLPVPLPPLAEQHRIVAKVDELMALCDQLEASLTEGEQTRSKLLEAVLHEALEPGLAA
ncbi:hypothetical protein AQZ52_02050 [Novosphingobium fuchskuhlense]|uniref:Type I restriction modification DNA specificity domain-containing protein n=1 Tax=Novosphingobium fuchskuhlense TaxID=1117702 RepID=A0A124JVB6_9SPHN|nr:restriction endonuclease subunit S [Novosphingobium fuchskuhlense]KUR72112.1 hypothetical protein AQZ52_02050 [Novosphingobium fuchskuhlense]